MGIYFGPVRKVSAASHPRSKICSDIFDSGDSGEPNGVNIQSMSAFKAAQVTIVLN